MTYMNKPHAAHFVRNPEAPDYLQLVRGGSRFRMMRLHDRMTAHNTNRPPSTSYASWREARSWGFHNWASAHAALSQGTNGTGFGKCTVWITHCGEYFRDERDSHDVFSRHGHTGWYTDTEQNETAVGIIVRLPHDRFLAGYRWTANNERVYFADVYTDNKKAARMADEHARVFAEAAQADAERFDAAQKLEIDIVEKEERLRECIALRNVARMQYVREEITSLIPSLRAMRTELAESNA